MRLIVKAHAPKVQGELVGTVRDVHGGEWDLIHHYAGPGTTDSVLKDDQVAIVEPTDKALALIRDGALVLLGEIE